MLVGPGEEMDLAALEAAEPADDVGRDRRIGVAQMGHVVDVVDRCGEVEDLVTQRCSRLASVTGYGRTCPM